MHIFHTSTFYPLPLSKWRGEAFYWEDQEREAVQCWPISSIVNNHSQFVCRETTVGGKINKDPKVKFDTEMEAQHISFFRLSFIHLLLYECKRDTLKVWMRCRKKQWMLRFCARIKHQSYYWCCVGLHFIRPIQSSLSLDRFNSSSTPGRR